MAFLKYNRAKNTACKKRKINEKDWRETRPC
jgi:hypothetical protein